MNHPWLALTASIFGLIIVYVVFTHLLQTSHISDPIEVSPKMKGVCWVGGDSIAAHNISQVKEIGVDWISQTPFGWMKGIDSPVVVGGFERAWWGEADRGLRHTTKLASAQGVKTILKPHIWLRSDDGKWRPDIAMNSEAEWQAWFESYGDWMMHYAVLAEELGIELLCIGTELHQTTKTHPEEWRQMIRQIKAVYSGELTYAANWYEEVIDVAFWDELDYIGVQAYYPLTRKTLPTRHDIEKGWKKPIRTLSELSKSYGKPVIFTEIGYKNTADAAREPWTWPQQMDDRIERSENTQIECYEGMFNALWDEPWLAGIFIWKWFHTTHRYEDPEIYWQAQEERRRNWAKKRGRTYKPRDIYFTPQRTGAIDVLRHWYQRPE
ncbi:MAG: hypothetical protein AAFQ02_10645 [Bacteroidota bacterium]